MEVDERLRWLEARISSSLHPRGDELRNLFSDDQSRAAILAFCNHSEARKLYVYQGSERQEFSREDSTGPIMASPTPPKSLRQKALIFMKCTNASRLSRENMGGDVVYSECSKLPIYHLELVLREVYLPMLISLDQVPPNFSGDKLIDLIQRAVGSMQVTSGQREGKVKLPIPSMDILAGATGGVGRSTLVHIMETSVVSWMKLVKTVLHFDPNSAILKSGGIYAGSMCEYEFWCSRLASLEAVRSQLKSIMVLNVLRSLDRVQSTYAHAFVHIHRDISKAIIDCEHVLSYLRTIQPWLRRLDRLQDPEALVRIFPPLMTTLLLIWQYSGVYCYHAHFQRILKLLSNHVMKKAKSIIGHSVLEKPTESLSNLKQALRICAAFRGCYLDFREKAVAVLKKMKEEKESQSQGGEGDEANAAVAAGESSAPRAMDLPAGKAGKKVGARSGRKMGGKVVGSDKALVHQKEFSFCSWPPRNSPVFSSINGIMERCNDLLELVQTLLDFLELKPLDLGAESQQHYRGNYIIADVFMNFRECMSCFQQQAAEDLLNIESDSSFEEHFYKFRLKVRELEQRLVAPLRRTYDEANSLPALLHVLELYQGISRREFIKAMLQPQLASVVSHLQAEVSLVMEGVGTDRGHLPPLPLRPPVSSRLLWLHALRARVEQPMETIKRVAPELLEGDEGWKLRQSHGDLIKLLETEMEQAESGWIQSVPPGLHKKLRDNILKREAGSRVILVNLDPTLKETLAEVHYLMAPPLGLRLPSQLRQLVKTVDYGYLQKKQTTLGVIVQVYNELQSCVSDIDRTLLQHKLNQVEKIVEAGLDQLDWLSTAFFDFTARLSASVCVELRSTIDQVHDHIYSICHYTDTWNAQEGLDIFDAHQPQDLEELNAKHNNLVETLSSFLPATMDRISKRIAHTFQCIHEASQESPAWLSYLRQVDHLVLSSLRIMTFKFISTLSHRTSVYEQGGAIPPLVTVELGLYGPTVRFFPPLSTSSAYTSVPEMIQGWMANYVELARHVPRLSARKGEDGYFQLAHRESDIRSAMGKICAHVETNCRQCQSLKKRFTIYSFMWEQDVNATFTDFLQGKATPHPRRFTRPETVRSRASARAINSASRPKSSSTSQSLLPVIEPSISSVTGVTDWEFLRPQPSYVGRNQDPTHKITLDDFDGEISVFQGILDRVKNIEDFNNVGWVCVDQRPIKDTLNSLANKWKRVYSSYLEKQIGVVLFNLDSFFEEIEPQVDLISGEETDTSAFMKIMSIFIKVNTQQVEMDNKFGVVTRAVVILDRFGHVLQTDLRKKFNQAPQRWSNLKKRIALCKQRIGPRIQARQEVISEDITRFGEIFFNLRANFNKSSCHRSNTSRGKALQILNDFIAELKTLQSQAKDLIELQELLQTSIFNFSLLKEFEEELNALCELWNISEVILGQHGEWSKCYWMKMNSSGLLSGIEKQLELISDLPPKLVQNWDIYHFLTNAVCTLQNTVPVLDGLKSSAMRPRHWKQVLRFASNGSSHYLTRGSSFDPSLLENLSFGHLMEMELHAHHKDVLLVVERAKKDVAIESLLNMFEEVWLSRQLELKEYKRVVDSAQQETISDFAGESGKRPGSTSRPGSTPVRVTSAVRSSKGVVYGPILLSATPGGGERGGSSSAIPLLTNTRGIFVTLESHQTSLQSLVGVSSATSFDDELSKWHKQLQTIEAVLITWLKVQQLWVQLEEVYSSTDVQQQLAQEAFTFSNMDREFRELMAQAKRNPAVLSICLREDLLLLLEKLSSSLFQCQAALVRHMEGRRSKCPWFFFLPLEDILQLTCYSSSLQQFSASLSGVVRHVGSVEFAGGGSSHIFKEGRFSHVAITHVATRRGEQLELNQAIACEGPVETIISKLLASISSTLRSHYTTILSQAAAQSSSLHTYWDSKMSTQCILLATHVVQDQLLTRALQEAASCNGTQPLDDLDKALQESLKALSNLMQGKVVEESSMGKSGSSFDSSAAMESVSSQLSVGQNIVIDGVKTDMVSRSKRTRPFSHAFISRLQKLAVVLYKFRNMVAELRAAVKESPSQDLTKTSKWLEVPHYHWLAEEKKATLTSLDASVTVKGSLFSGNEAVMADREVEKSLQHILLLLKDRHNIIITGARGIGKRSMVSHLSQLAGQTLVPLVCSSQVSHTTIFNHIRGMTATGCWLYLHSIDRLNRSVLQSACSLLALLHEAHQSKSSSFKWMDKTVDIFPENPGACLASISVPIHSSTYLPLPVLPTSLVESFKICKTPSQDFVATMTMMLAVRNFNNASSLSECIDKFCRAYREIFEGRSGGLQKSEVLFNFQWMSMIASLSQRHMRELYSFGPFDSGDSDPLLTVGAEGLHVPSIVYSEISGVTRLPFKEKLGGERDEDEYQKASQRKCLEELSVILALKDSVLSSLLPEGKDYSVVVMLMGEVFLSCDIEGLLVHEENVREGMAMASRQDRGAGESARESRAASVVQTLQDRGACYYGFSIEQNIVHSCHLLHFIPTSPFQAAVSQIMSLVQANQMVAVHGPSGCGKTAAIHVAAEALRQSSQACYVGISTIAVEVMKKEQLLGYQDAQRELWQEGILPRCLSSILSTSPSEKGPLIGPLPSSSMAASSSTYTWIVLEGNLSPEQMDTLSSCTHDGTLLLPNGHPIRLDSSTTFIYELTDCSNWTPAFSSKVAKVAMSPGTITWRDITRKWLNNLSEDLKPAVWDILESLFEKYLPPTLQFISPALTEVGGLIGKEVDTSSSSLGAADPVIVPQELKLSVLHVVNSCCQILQGILPFPSPDNHNYALDIEWTLVYAIIWGCGGFLSTKNKLSFDHWWHSTFSSGSINFASRKGGTLWNHYYKPGSLTCSTWDSSTPAFSLPADDKLKPVFVPTARSAALAYLLASLVKRNVPVLLDGAKGSGKTSVLKHVLSKQTASEDGNVLHIHCDPLTESQDIWNQIWDKLEWDWGKKYKPKDGKRLVCLIDDIHNTGTSSTSELLREHLSTGFICDPDIGKWYQATGICHVATTDYELKNSSTLSPQVLKHFVVLHWDGYSSDELVSIVEAILSSHFQVDSQVTGFSKSGSLNSNQFPADLCHSLAAASVQVYFKLCSMFLDIPERFHYAFVLKQLIGVVRHLCIKFPPSSSWELQDVLTEWQRVSWWKWAGQMSSEVDRNRYWEILSHALKKYLGQDSSLSVLLSQTSTRLPEEAISQLRSKLHGELVEFNYNMGLPTLHVNLYDGVIEELHYLCQAIQSPPDLGHVLLLNSPHQEPAVRLAALHCGFMVDTTTGISASTGSSNAATPAQPFSVSQFHLDLVSIYTSAGLKNEKILLLLTEKELFQESFLAPVYKLVKDCAITTLFSKEEQAKIVNGIRGDMTHNGVTFTKETAWLFFVSRVRSNVRVVLSLSSLNSVMESGIYKWKGLLNSLSTYCELPWERKRLIKVASYHLKECTYLAPGQMESLAHLLASVHLHLSSTNKIRTSNIQYQSCVEKIVFKLNDIHKSGQSRSTQLTAALDCLVFAKERASKLCDRIQHEKVILGEKSEACVKLLNLIGQDTAISTQHSRLVVKQKERISHLKKVLPDFEHAYEQALQEKDNLIANSKKLVREMHQEGLSELRSLQRPPADIEELLVAVIMIVKGTPSDTSWTKGAKRIMANLDRFCELLLEFSAHEDNSDTLLEALDPINAKPTFTQENFSQHQNFGLAASQLCAWVQGVTGLHSTLQTKVRPLLARAQSMKSSLVDFSDKLMKEQGKVAVLEERLQGLSAALESASVEKSKQQNFLNNMKKDLKQTEDFIGSLAGLEKLWEQSLQESNAALQLNMGTLCLNIALSSYLSSAPHHIQMELTTVDLIPLLKERGMELCWGLKNPFLLSMPSLLSAASDEAEEQNTSATTPESIAQKDEKNLEPLKDSDSDAASKAVIQTVESHMSKSFACLSERHLCHMLPEAQVDAWLSLPEAFSSPCFLLFAGLIHDSWNKWPLLYDPQKYARKWIASLKEGIVCIDARDGVYESLEHAIVHGESVLLTNFSSPADPIILPVIELAHTWSGTKDASRVILFGGHRLYVHKNFRLYLTTNTPPSSLPATITCDLNVINLDYSIPLAQDILLYSACKTLLPDCHKQFGASCKDLAETKSELRGLDQDLFKSLPKQGQTDSYWNSTEKIRSIVSKKTNIAQKMETLMQELKGCSGAMSRLLPIALHASLAFNLVQAIGKSKLFCSLSWEHFLEMYINTLSDITEARDGVFGEQSWRNAAPAGWKSAQREVILKLNHRFVREAFKTFDEHSFSVLVTSLHLLSCCDITMETIPILTHQLFYLSQGEPFFDEEPDSTTPRQLSEVKSKLWRKLTRLPLSRDYLTRVMELPVDEKDDFWVKVANGEEIEVSYLLSHPVSLSYIEGWHSLDDLVLLRYLNEDAYLKSVVERSQSLADAVFIPHLDDFLNAVTVSCSPSMLFYDEACPHSQAVLYSLEEEMCRAIESQSKTLISLSMSAGLEEQASELLLQPKSDFLLLSDIHFTSEQWRNTLLWKINKAKGMGCNVVLTTVMSLSLSTPQHTVSRELVNACQTAHLSRLATNKTRGLPLQVWFFDPDSNTQRQHSFWALLAFNLAHFPSDLLQRCHSQNGFKKAALIYRLFVFHTAVSMTQFSGAEIVPVHLSSIVAMVTRLLSMEESRIEESVLLDSLVEFVRHIYSGCVYLDELDKVIQSSLYAQSHDGVIVPLPGIEIEVPDEGVDLTLFLNDKMKSYRRDISEKCRSLHAVGDAVDFAVLPTFIQASSSEMYHQSQQHLPILPGSCHAPSSTPEAKLVAMMNKWDRQKRKYSYKQLQDTLETCLELLPHPLQHPGTEDLELVADRFAKMEAVAELESRDLLVKFAHMKRTQEFNCKLAQIQGDIQALMDYSIVDFDGLPEHLSHVKGSLESDIMPKRWMGLEGPSVALPLPLLEGLKALINDSKCLTISRK